MARVILIFLLTGCDCNYYISPVFYKINIGLDEIETRPVGIQVLGVCDEINDY